MYVHLLSGFEGIGEAKESVQCDFGKRSFDLRVLGYKGKNWRLRKDGLDKEIDPAGSRVKVGKQEHDHGRTDVLRKSRASTGPTTGWTSWPSGPPAAPLKRTPPPA